MSPSLAACVAVGALAVGYRVSFDGDDFDVVGPLEPPKLREPKLREHSPEVP